MIEEMPSILLRQMDSLNGIGVGGSHHDVAGHGNSDLISFPGINRHNGTQAKK